MKVKLCFVILFILSHILLSNNINREAQFVPGSVIIKFKSGNNNAQIPPTLEIARQTGAQKVEPLFKNPLLFAKSKTIDISSFYELKFSPQTDIFEIISSLINNDFIEYAQPNFLYKLHEAPNDPDYSRQPHWPQIDAPEAWDITHGDSSVIIAIIDSGVDYNHADLLDNIWINENEIEDRLDNDGNGYIDDIRGWDFVRNAINPANGEDGQFEDNDPMDGEGHGTHVAGIASAVTNNDIGVAGIGWNCEIMALRAGYKGSDGNGYIMTDAAIRAIQYAAENGAAVMNASFGGRGDDYAMRDMMRWAFDNDMVIVKSAGNEKSDIGYSPETADFVVTVAAVDDRDHKATYSNYGKWVKISAPGGDSRGGRPQIYSTTPNSGYGSLNGTSQASPIVAGVVGLIRSLHPDWTAAQAMMHVVDTAENIDAMNPEYTGQLGKKGRVNAHRAVSESFASQPEFHITQLSVEDLRQGNGDQKMSAGETIDIFLQLTNVWNDALNVNLELTTEDPQAHILSNTAFFETVPGVSSINNSVNNIGQWLTVQIDSLAFPHNVIFNLNITANDGFSQDIKFQIAIDALVLFVDDDNGMQNVENYYFTTLDSIGMPYDIWDRTIKGRLTAARLRKYDIVVWSCENAFPTLTENDRNDLEGYLKVHGKLFISGQNLAWDLCASQTANDITLRNYQNQFMSSSGRSKQFYENYLHSSYSSDKSAYSFVQGVAHSPIGVGLEFAVAEPLREIDEQSPDEILPFGNSVSVFTYPNNMSAGTSYAGSHHTVTFSFGGIEAIADPGDRLQVMDRILTFFTGLKVKIEKIENVEDAVDDFVVKAVVLSENPLENVYLYWRNTKDKNYTKQTMNAQNDTLYSGSIPLQSYGSEIEYIVQAINQDGIYSPAKINRIKVENKPPAVSVLDEKKSSLSRHPFVMMTASDVSGIDSTSAKVYFWTKSTIKDSMNIVKIKQNQYGGHIVGQFNFGDTLYYQFSVNDLSARSVRGFSAFYQMPLGIEGFEYGLDFWSGSQENWKLESVRKNSGDYSLHGKLPLGELDPEKLNSAMIYKNLDLSDLEEATLSFWHQYALEIGELAFIEASNDGTNWKQLNDPITGAILKFSQAQVSLNDFAGPGNEHVDIRFRLQASSPVTGPGWFIDDLMLLSYSTLVKKDSFIPREFALYDNYPNPFNNSTIIQFSLPSDSEVTVAIYNTLGQKIYTLFSGFKSAGLHQINWSGIDEKSDKCPSGLYFYEMKADEFSQVKKLIIVR